MSWDQTHWVPRPASGTVSLMLGLRNGVRAIPSYLDFGKTDLRSTCFEVPDTRQGQGQHALTSFFLLALKADLPYGVKTQNLLFYTRRRPTFVSPLTLARW